RVDELLAGELVKRARLALRETARVHEDERRAVRTDELEDLWVDRGPDRRALDRGDRTGRDLGRLAQARHVLDRNLDPELERFLSAGVEHAHRTWHAVVETAEEPRDLVERTLRRGETHPPQRWSAAPASLLESLQREREVRPALRRHDRVDLVDDHALDRAERVPRKAREDQVERFRRRDEDVGGLALVVRSLTRG